MDYSHQVAEVKVSYSSKIPASKRLKIACSKDAYHIFRQHWDMDRIGFVEDFKILLLNRANEVLGISHAFSGGMSGVVADPKIIFAIALKSACAGIIVAHYAKRFVM